MSAIGDAISAIRDALRLSDEVKRVGDTLSSVAAELRDHDRRLIRLETRWETAMELAGRPASLPKLPEDKG
jgi:hypothetical protein